MTAAPLDVPALAGAVKALPPQEQSRLFDILASEDVAFQEYMEDAVDAATIHRITAAETEWTPWETVKARCDALHHHAE
jgi:hypothetical protein